MRGQVLGVDTRSGDGLIAGDDGRRYTFAPSDWAHRGEPSIGVAVDFEPEGRGARNIFPLLPATASGGAVALPPRRMVARERNKFAAAALAFFFGVFGLHRFYLGRTGSGILMLVLTLSAVGALFSVPWALIDTVRYLIMSNREFNARYARD